MTPVEELQHHATEWLAANREHPPTRLPDYGAICPPERVDHGRTWQRRIHDAGLAGIHWPVEHGGRGLTPEHNAAV